ncbi:MAG: S8 family serine peptidase [Flavobacteriales bacterium]|nr:S8 family serine peptidase [Flavobacteriales bacterium]
MKLRFLVVLSIMVCVGQAQDFVRGELVVRFKPEVARQIHAGSMPLKLEEVLARHQVSITPSFPIAAFEKSMSSHSFIDPNVFFNCRFSEDLIPMKLARMLESTGLVEYAEPRYIGELAYNTNDPMVSNQLYLTTINAFKAWDVAKGSTNIKIGLLDSGVDTLHADLYNNIYRNAGDPINGVDDDADGYTDNYLGWNLANNSNQIQFTTTDHGVQMFGAMSPVTDNSVGISGVAFNCKVMPIKITTSGQVTHGYEGIKYAADMGCKVINCSWNFSTYSKFGEDMVNYAESKDALVVAATGNQGKGIDNYPAAYSNCLGVAGLDYQDNALSNSNYGFYVSLGTVGINVYSTHSGNKYDVNSGTSYSSAIVSGAAALLFSHKPSLTPAEAKAYLMASSRNIYEGTKNAPWKNEVGKGALDVEAALKYDGSAFIEVSSIELKDKDGVFRDQDTIDVTAILTNRLNHSSGVQVILRAMDGYGAVVNSTVTLGSIAKNASVSTPQQGLTLRLGGGIPSNYPVEFELALVEGGDTTTEGFYVFTNPTYMVINENNIKTTLGNRGTYGWYLYPQLDGLGLHYKDGAQLLYEGGFMIGAGSASSPTVVDRIRGIRDVEQVDFETKSVLHLIPSFKGSALSVEGEFEDNGTTSRIGVQVKQRAHAWKETSRANFVILEYEVKSANSSSLSNLYGGLLADWDIEDFERNKAEYDGQRYLAYSYSGEGKGEYCGIQLLALEDNWKTYAIDHVNGGAGGIDLTDNDVFSKREKYETLVFTREKAGEGSAEGNDVLQVLSSGPHQIHADSTKTFAYAILVAPSLDELKKSADTAFYLYNSRIPDGLNELVNTSNVNFYPNPATDIVQVQHALNKEVSGEVYNINGVKVLQFSGVSQTIDFSLLPQGLYVISWTDGRGSGSVKMVVK